MLPFGQKNYLTDLSRERLPFVCWPDECSRIGRSARGLDHILLIVDRPYEWAIFFDDRLQFPPVTVSKSDTHLLPKLLLNAAGSEPETAYSVAGFAAQAKPLDVIALGRHCEEK